MEGPSAPIPVAVSPMEGPSAPIPVAVSPMEGPSAPIPVAVSPMEGPSAPIPVAVSPMEGPSAPIPVSSTPTVTAGGNQDPHPTEVTPEESQAMGSFQCVVTDEELAGLDLGRLNITSSPPPPSSPPRPPPSFSIIFDNLNFQGKTHHQTVNQHNKLYNWTHHMAVQDKVNPHHLPNSGATKPLPDIDLDEVLPTHHTQVFYRKETIVLCSRTVTKYCKAFKPFQDVVVRHIPHQYSEVMAEKSVEVPLGLLFKDENVTGDLVDILLHLQKEYVPRREGELCPIFAGGDRLTEGNSRNIQWAFQDGDNPEDRLEGLDFKYEDWHGIRNFYEIDRRIFYSEKSAKEHGTMCSNMNKLKASNAKKGPHQDYNAYKQHVDTEVDAIILAATMEHFGMETLEDMPTKGDFPDPETLAQASKEQRRQWLTTLVGAVVDKFVMMEEGDILGNLTRCVKDSFYPKECPSHPCRYPGCERVYLFPTGRDKHEVNVHGGLNVPPTPTPTPAPEDVPSDKPKESKESEDFKRNYTLSRLSLGLLLRNMRDSVKEGDGERLQRLYSYALLYYRAYGHTQYAYSCLLMKVQIASILSPYKAHQLTWNRFFNRSGGVGRNISLDLRLEHLNNFLKSFLKNMGPNLNEQSASRVSRSLHCLDQLMTNQDRTLGVKKPSGYHHSASVEDDVKLLLEEIRGADLLAIVPGRSFDAFPSFNRNLLSKLKYKPMADWMKGRFRLWNKKYHTDV
ncbi:uncharacterized protein [Branchiostoma lanceolatum]|uniref:uncharacterized protein n=1 Tax=Branchiostoma lanceolatum TaxID=7740 RepID=UPI0034538C1E